MTDFSCEAEFEFNPEYQHGLDAFLGGRRLPMVLDEFVALEYRYYQDWNRKRMRAGAASSRTAGDSGL